MDQELKGFLMQILHRLDEQGAKLDEQGAKLDGQDSKMDAMEARLNAKMDTMEVRLNARMDAMDSRLSARMDEMDSRLSARMDAMDAKWDKKFDMLMSEVAVIKEDITEIWATMATKDEVNALTQEMNEMNFKFDILRSLTYQHERDILQLQRKQEDLKTLVQL